MAASRAARRAPAHSYERFTDFCTRCGAHRSSVWLDEWPAACPAQSNVIGISHILAMRHLAMMPVPSPLQRIDRA